MFNNDHMNTTYEKPPQAPQDFRHLVRLAMGEGRSGEATSFGGGDEDLAFDIAMILIIIMTTPQEDLHRAILASMQEAGPSAGWVKDSSGRHTNVAAMLEWPSDDSDDSEAEHTTYTQIGGLYTIACIDFGEKTRGTSGLGAHSTCHR